VKFDFGNGVETVGPHLHEFDSANCVGRSGDDFVKPFLANLNRVRVDLFALVDIEGIELPPKKVS
jgi:hypothetical protein